MFRLIAVTDSSTDPVPGTQADHPGRASATPLSTPRRRETGIRPKITRRGYQSGLHHAVRFGVLRNVLATSILLTPRRSVSFEGLAMVNITRRLNRTMGLRWRVRTDPIKVAVGGGKAISCR